MDIENLAKALKVLESAERSVIDDVGKYVIVRTLSAGVFAGNLQSRCGQEVVLKNARRLWKWAGAASLSELAERGTSKPAECQFPCEVARVELLQVIEILDVQPGAEASIKGVPVWTR